MKELAVGALVAYVAFEYFADPQCFTLSLLFLKSVIVN